MEVLIGHGARLDQHDRNDHNILHLICAVGNAEVLEVIIYLIVVDNPDKVISTSVLFKQDEIMEIKVGLIFMAQKKNNLRGIYLWSWFL